ncbi:GGDEF domain-containing protein [Deinococcus sp. Marseille-Q6407]|uniref:GGDEF domain-containing protein n=1 Tax=Deinococcus sp. Marseille-Q6407 TaxID=2969223 RepID=UPI0021C04705|nr:GGDEF domain-containing protein [Deinococcus sp. Marseille-Q6407]
MLRSRPPQPPVTETDLDTPELQQGWQVLIRWGTLGILLSCAMAWFWSTGDTWDRLIDPPIYGVLAALLLTVLANRRGQISLSALITWLPVSASLWLLTKLGLLLGLGSPLSVLLREMNESLVWVPPLLAWNMLTGAERQGGLIPSQIILALLTVICLVGGTYWFRTVGWAPEAGGGLGQLWLASLVTYAGMYYFTQRMQKLQAIQGERRALARMAYHDLLTGLPNRLSLEQE